MRASLENNTLSPQNMACNKRILPKRLSHLPLKNIIRRIKRNFLMTMCMGIEHPSQTFSEGEIEENIFLLLAGYNCNLERQLASWNG